MPISEQIKWGLGPTAPAGPGQSPGLYFPNRTFNFLLLELRFPYLRAYRAEPLAFYRRLPPTLATACTTLPHAASISASVRVRSFGCRTTSTPNDFWPAA